MERRPPPPPPPPTLCHASARGIPIQKLSRENPSRTTESKGRTDALLPLAVIKFKNAWGECSVWHRRDSRPKPKFSVSVSFSAKGRKVSLRSSEFQSSKLVNFQRALKFSNCWTRALSQKNRKSWRQTLNCCWKFSSTQSAQTKSVFWWLSKNKSQKLLPFLKGRQLWMGWSCHLAAENANREEVKNAVRILPAPFYEPRILVDTWHGHTRGFCVQPYQLTDWQGKVLASWNYF